MPLILRFLNRVGVAFYATLLLATALPAAELPVKVTGPENLRQHVAPAKEVAERFIKFFDQSNLRAAQALSRYRLDLKGREDRLAAFGTMESRSLVSARVSDSFPPMTDGIFVVFNYETSFTKKKSLPQKLVIKLSEAGKPEVVQFDINSAD